MVVSGHHIHALWWGPQASRKWSWRADSYDEKAMPGREPPGCLATFAEILRPGAPVGDFRDRVACGTAGPPSAQPPVPLRPRWATGWAASPVPPAGWFPSEVVCQACERRSFLSLREKLPDRKSTR